MHPDEIDETDWMILRELQSDGRLSFNELGRRVHLSAPAVAERVRRLESRGVITGYTATVDPVVVGQPVTAFIQLHCDPGRCLLRTGDPEELPEVIEIHKLAGRYCSLLRVRATSMANFEGLVERIGTHGTLETHLVMSTQFARSRVEPITTERPVTQAERWNRPAP
ncbi:MAG: Lrp/AsnC family transcriptional regulator [Leifsonia sp.]